MTAEIEPPVASELAVRWPPRCPPLNKADTVEDLLPYLDEVARRPYNNGLHAGWGLERGERVLLYVDNWYDPLCVEATLKILEKYGCEVTVQRTDRGPVPDFDGHDEVEIFLSLTKELSEWMDQWKALEASGKYDKLLWGFGGPVLSDAKVKVQRFPFMSREMLASRAHTLPYEVLQAIDDWTWAKTCAARRVHITDPEGTDLHYTNRDEYYNDERTEIRENWLEEWVPSNKNMWRTFLPGHVWGKPWFLSGLEDGEGVMAGTMNHIGPYPHMKMRVEKGRVVDIEGGGQFGEKLRRVKAETDHLQYPGHPDKGLMYWWEASIGTNPKIHRVRENYLQGWNCGLYERMRSGVIHLGFGTVITTDVEREAARQGLPVGHWHIHLYFPTVRLEMADGSEELLIDQGHLKALDDPKIREIAAKYGDPDEILTEDWIPAVPGLNMEGDYFRDYAEDPTDWTKTELHICRKWHNLYMKMVAPSDGKGENRCH
ncbi:MAG: hypothetical protein JWM61_1534 [Micrococcaceae bacterium]|nr:hypothetical protein [Micrococcaceae bacterium]